MNAALEVAAEPEARLQAGPAAEVAAAPADPTFVHLLRGEWVSHIERRGDYVHLRTRAGGVYAIDVAAVKLAAIGAGLRFRDDASPLVRVQ